MDKIPVGAAETVRTKKIKIDNKDFNCIIQKIYYFFYQFIRFQSLYIRIMRVK